MKEKKNQSGHQKKVQSERNCPAHTYHPNANHTSEFDPTYIYPHSTSTQTPVVKSTATSIPIMMYNLAEGMFDGVPYPPERSMAEEIPSVHNSNPPPIEAIPNSPTFQVREDTPWPNTESASTTLFETRADWPIPPSPAPTKTEVPSRIAVIPHVMVFPKNWRKMYMGTTVPHLHKGRGRRHGGLEWQQAERSTKKSPSTNAQYPQSFDVPDRYSEQIRLRREWDEKMECLNEKYGLDYYSSSESNSDFEPEHKYKTLI